MYFFLADEVFRFFKSVKTTMVSAYCLVSSAHFNVPNIVKRVVRGKSKEPLLSSRIFFINELMAHLVGGYFRYSSILGRGSYRSAHDPIFEKGSFSVLISENHIKTQISLRESIYERGKC